MPRAPRCVAYLASALLARRARDDGAAARDRADPLGAARRARATAGSRAVAWPIWIYVSVTGVLIYVLLYHLNPAPAECARRRRRIRFGFRGDAMPRMDLVNAAEVATTPAIQLSPGPPAGRRVTMVMTWFDEIRSRASRRWPRWPRSPWSLPGSVRAAGRRTRQGALPALRAVPRPDGRGQPARARARDRRTRRVVRARRSSRSSRAAHAACTSTTSAGCACARCR